MRVFKIYFTVNDIQDYFVVSGETLEEVKKNTIKESTKRGLSPEKNNMWSEESPIYYQF